MYQHKTDDVVSAIAEVVNTCADMERATSELFGLSLTDLDALEVGAGQQLLRLKYFSRNNRLTALDYDIIVQGFDPVAYWRVFRSNGLKRVVKSGLRKVAGIDRAYWRELETRTGPTRSRLNVVQGDAHAMPWPDASFDFVYSFSVFEHLRDPAQALDEVVRILKPGGVFCISTHMYSSDSGAHDPRSFLADRNDLAPWAHLRPAHRNSVKPNAYCNGWRNAEWEQLFKERCADVVLEHHGRSEWAASRLPTLRDAGELTEYTDDELLFRDLWALWRKPKLNVE